MKSILQHIDQHVWNADKMNVPFNEFKPSSSLIFFSPTIEPLDFWEVLWAVGVTNFIIKFLIMGIKCLILLLPSSQVSYRTQVRAVDFFFGLLVNKKKKSSPLLYLDSAGSVGLILCVSVSRGGG